MLRQFLIGALSLSLFAQETVDRYEPLRRTLGLRGDPQTWQLNPAQQWKLAEIAKVLQRYQTSAGAVVLGLMDAEEWPSGWACGLNSNINAYAKEFDLTAEQVTRLGQLQQDVRQRAVDGIREIENRYAKLMPGQGIPPAEWATVQQETAKLVKRRDEARPPRDLAMALLNEAQKTQFAAFRSDLELAREALALHLVRVPPLPEVFCH